MHLTQLRLRDFRNYARLDARFEAGFHLLLGQNAQGKTNLLEAIYLLATLRSFRGVGSAQLVRQGARGYFVGTSVVGPLAHEVRMFWSPQERRLTLDGQVVRRLTDYLGVLRVVVFCSEDIQLVKGTSRIRRRFLDLLLSQTQPGYLPLLQRYLGAVRARNALLKQRVTDEAALAGFTDSLVRLGQQLMEHRHALVPRLVPIVQANHARIAGTAEVLEVAYRPSVRHDFAVELAQSKARERLLRATPIGPHRDDLAFQINGLSAAQFASEGQKRSLALALKMAQAEFLNQVCGAPPILLLDDVMGELDANRRAAFLPLLARCQGGQGQAFMTCTEENWPRDLGLELTRWKIHEGRLASLDSSARPSIS